MQAPVLSFFASLNKAKSTLLLNKELTELEQHRMGLEYKPVWGVYVGVEGPAQHPYTALLSLGVKQEPGAWPADANPSKTSWFFLSSGMYSAEIP